jgi:hypothetical protein
MKDSENGTMTKYIITNLALLKTQKGDLKGAKMLFEQAVELMQTEMGPNHPETIQASGNLLGFKSIHEELTPDFVQPDYCKH